MEEQPRLVVAKVPGPIRFGLKVLMMMIVNCDTSVDKYEKG